MIIPKYLQPLDGMKRVTRQELADHFDEILETVETDSIGYVVKDPEGKNDVVLCPAEWFDVCFDEDFGCIVNSALDSELRIGELDDADEWSLLRSELQVRLDELQEKKG